MSKLLAVVAEYSYNLRGFQSNQNQLLVLGQEFLTSDELLMSRYLALFLLTVACGYFLASCASAAPPQYHVVDLGTLGGGGSTVRAINASGQVVGYSFTSGGAQHAFLYSGGTMIDLGTLGGSTSVAEDINDSGIIVGQSRLTGTNAPSHAFVYSAGTMTDLNISGTRDSHAYGIDASGKIVGQYNNGLRNRAFQYQSGTLTDLGTLSPTNSGNSIALGVSPSGIVAGDAETGGGNAFAVLFSDGTKTNLGNLGGDNNSAAHDVNDSAQAVGTSFINNSTALRLFV